jgi:S-adenosylmethionine hydrolase
MALVTFISDFGDQDYYVPAVKAKMLAINPQLSIIDLSHQINKFDLEQAAFLLKASFRGFPKGTVHLIAVNTTGEMTEGYIGAKLEEHIFIAPNNGILSLIADKEPGILVKFADIHLQESSFPTKDILAPIAAKVASGAAIHDFGGPIDQIRKIMPRHPKATKEFITGHVVRVDRYGNAITNIKKELFDKLNPGRFTIEIGRESLDHLHSGFENVDQGDCFAYFNSLGLLEIAINQGDASSLLGLRFESKVSIFFKS